MRFAFPRGVLGRSLSEVEAMCWLRLRSANEEVIDGSGAAH